MADKDTIKKIKDALNIVDIVGEQVVLRKAGSRYKGLSPFNQEKTPSFFVNPDTQLFHCFSTNQGGDIIDFLVLTKGLSFPEAVEELAQRAGIKIQSKPKSAAEVEREKKEEEAQKIYLKLNRYVAHFYQAQLAGAGGGIGRDYAQKRGLKKETLEAYLIGYVPDGWTALRDYLQQVKAPLLKAVELGLLRTRDGEKAKEDGSNLYDTFRNRLMFPIRDGRGEVVGFGGRWLGGEGAEVAKYMNSPESLVYNKGKVLYNLDRARKHIRAEDTVVLVEGYMDCIALDQAGIPYVVATCGTALTPNHVKMLKALAPRIVCLYDADAAGQKATERNMEMFLEVEGYPILGAHIPNGKDPDEFLRSSGEEGAKSLEKIIKNAPALIDLWIEKIVKEAPPNMQGRTEAVEKIAVKLAQLSDDLWIRARISSVAKALGVEGSLLAEAVRRKRGGKQASSTSPQAAHANAKPAPNSANNTRNNFHPLIEKAKKNQVQGDTKGFGFERQFLTELLKNPAWISHLRQMHAANPGIVMPYVEDKTVGLVMDHLLAPLSPGEQEKDCLQSLMDRVRDNESARNMIAEASLGEATEMSAEHLNAALKRLREVSVKRKTKLLSTEIQKADAMGDHGKREQYQRELNEMIRSLKL